MQDLQQKKSLDEWKNATVVLIFKRDPKMLNASCWLHAAEQYLITETAFAPFLTGENSAGWGRLQ
jgi:hypothetical protein